jgi:hypothetical protein
LVVLCTSKICLASLGYSGLPGLLRSDSMILRFLRASSVFFARLTITSSAHYR